MYTTNSLTSEINKVLKNSREYIFPEISFVLHFESSDYLINLPMHLDIESDFNKELTNNISVNFMMPLGDFKEILLPNKDEVEITIIMTYNSKRIVKRRLRFIMLTADNKFDKSVYSSKTKNELNNLDMINVTGQCVDFVLIGLKQYIISGIYREYTLERFVKGVFGKYLKQLSVGDKEFKYKLAFIDFDNEHTYDHIIVNSNTKLIKLPYILQNGDYGIYNGGLNLFIYRHEDGTIIINIYPLYSFDNFDKRLDSKLWIYDSEKISTSLNEKDFYREKRMDGLMDFKIVSSNVDFVNKGVNKTVSVGDGLFNLDPNNLVNIDMKGYDKKDIIFDTENLLNKEVDESNNSFISNLIDTDGDDNLFKYRSIISENNTILAQVNLPKVDSSILIPGMPIGYYSLKNDTVVFRRGNLQNVVTTFNIFKKTSATILHVALERKSKDK